jgi:hypothetical protein
MQRCLEPELLDSLPPEDVSAIHSRRDLRKLNWWMGNARFMADALNSAFKERPIRRLLELGGGDGTFLLSVAKRLNCRQREPEAILLDQQKLLTTATRSGLQKFGWRIETVTADVFDWLRQPGAPECDAIVANLFLHHFPNERLIELFALAQRKTRLVVAVEPRRGGLPLLGSRFVWAIGCNHVTRHDAVISVRSGFARQELSALWPQPDGWVCEERPAGFSSHLFVAKYRQGPTQPHQAGCPNQ